MTFEIILSSSCLVRFVLERRPHKFLLCLLSPGNRVRPVLPAWRDSSQFE